MHNILSTISQLNPQCQIFLEKFYRTIPVASLAGELKYQCSTTRKFVLWKGGLYGPEITRSSDSNDLAQVKNVIPIFQSDQLPHSGASKISYGVHSWVQGYVVSSILNGVQVGDECHQQSQNDGTAFIDTRQFVMKNNHEFGNHAFCKWTVLLKDDIGEWLVSNSNQPSEIHINLNYRYLLVM